jgi:hypothetical protein
MEFDLNVSRELLEDFIKKTTGWDTIEEFLFSTLDLFPPPQLLEDMPAFDDPLRVEKLKAWIEANPNQTEEFHQALQDYRNSIKRAIQILRNSPTTRKKLRIILDSFEGSN